MLAMVPTTPSYKPKFRLNSPFFPLFHCIFLCVQLMLHYTLHLAL